MTKIKFLTNKIADCGYIIENRFLT